MREESCPQRIGKSHRLHPAEQVVKVQHAAVLAPPCAPRTSITGAATACRGTDDIGGDNDKHPPES